MNTQKGVIVKFKTVNAKNALTKGRDVFQGRVVGNGVKGIKEIASDMVMRGCNVEATTIAYVLEFFTQNLPDMIAADGCRRNLGDFATVYPYVSGSFPEPGALPDPERNRLKIGIAPHKGFRDSIERTSLCNVTGAAKPWIDYVSTEDCPTKNVVAFGRVSDIRGRDLMLAPDRPDEGVWLTDGSLGLPLRLALTVNNPVSLSFVFPAATAAADVPSGSYNIELRTRGGRGAGEHLFVLTQAVEVRTPGKAKNN